MFNFLNLDDQTRSFMVKAIDDAERNGQIYYSPRLSTTGRQQWLELLQEAAGDHDEQWLAQELESRQLLKDIEVAQKPRGGYTVRHTPNNAAEGLAQAQFNRFYMLGLCKRAALAGIAELEVYRARESTSPRPESEALIGTRIPVKILEAQLSDSDASFKSMLIQPNSGLSLKIPE